MEILTGIPAGMRGEDGKFPAQTLYALVDERLAKLAKYAPAGFSGGQPGQG